MLSSFRIPLRDTVRGSTTYRKKEKEDVLLDYYLKLSVFFDILGIISETKNKIVKLCLARSVVAAYYASGHLQYM